MKQRILALSKSGRAQMAFAAVTLASAGPSFADGIDTTAAAGYIAAGVTAAGLVGGLMFGLVALIGSIKKAQRAGT